MAESAPICRLVLCLDCTLSGVVCNLPWSVPDGAGSQHTKFGLDRSIVLHHQHSQRYLLRNTWCAAIPELLFAIGLAVFSKKVQHCLDPIGTGEQRQVSLGKLCVDRYGSRIDLATTNIYVLQTR